MKLNITLANFILAAAISVAPSTVLASEPGDTIKTVAGDFDEVFGDLQDAVINRGLVIDYVGDVGKMLERTADVRNLAMCPYVVFAYEARVEPGKFSVGYRQIKLAPSSASQAAQTKVHDLLQAVVNEATGENQ